MDFAAGVSPELRHDGAGAPDQSADGGRVAHQPERDLPRKNLEHRPLRTVVPLLRRGGVVVVGFGGGGGWVLHCGGDVAARVETGRGRRVSV